MRGIIGGSLALWRDEPDAIADLILAIEAEARAAPVGESGPEGVTPTHARIALAAALSNAKIDCDYGEDVDRLVAALEARGYTVATRWYPPDCAPLDVERLARALPQVMTQEEIGRASCRERVYKAV